MKTSMPLALAFVFAALSSAAHAVDSSAASAPTGQQNKMVTCQKEAGDKGLSGKDRQAYVTDCLKAKPAMAAAPAASATQGQKLGACSKEAASKGLKGDARNKFLSDCSKA